MKLYRPLYGSRDAPQTRFSPISQVLRRQGFAQYRTDFRLFGLYGNISAEKHERHPQWLANNNCQRLVCLNMWAMRYSMELHMHVGDPLIANRHWPISPFDFWRYQMRLHFADREFLCSPTNLLNYTVHLFIAR